MTIKITRPLFADSAKGRIRSVGKFIEKNGKTYLVSQKKNTSLSKNLPEAMSNCLGIAKKLHSEIPPTQVIVGGQFVMRIIPIWSEYWAQYLIDNPSCLL